MSLHNRVLKIVLLLILSQLCFAQKNNLDSLKKINKGKKPTNLTFQNNFNTIHYNLLKLKISDTETSLLHKKISITNKEIKKELLLRLIYLIENQNPYNKVLKFSVTLNAFFINYNEEVKYNIDLKKGTTNYSNSYRNKFMIFISLVFIILILIIFMLIVKMKINSVKIKNLIIKNHLLKSQMNPHFIFNTLSHIQTSILKNENTTAVKYLVKFSKLFRYSLENGDYNQVELLKVKQIIIDYLDMQNLRLDNRLMFNFDIDIGIDEGSVYIPSFLIHPIIEDVIEYDLEGLKKPEINISIMKNDSYLLCHIKHNGINSYKTNSRNSNKGYKLSNKTVDARLRLFSKKQKNTFKYKTEDLLTIDSKTVGTLITVHLPYIEK